MKVQNYYQILGIDPFVSQAEIRQAYHARLKEYRPDKIYEHNTFEFKRFQSVMEAYESLKTPEKRAAYDAMLKIEISNDTPRLTAPAHPKNDNTEKKSPGLLQWLFGSFKQEHKG